jgi:hypothetical protein
MKILSRAVLYKYVGSLIWHVYFLLVVVLAPSEVSQSRIGFIYVSEAGRIIVEPIINNYFLSEGSWKRRSYAVVCALFAALLSYNIFVYFYQGEPVPIWLVLLSAFFSLLAPLFGWLSKSAEDTSAHIQANEFRPSYFVSLLLMSITGVLFSRQFIYLSQHFGIFLPKEFVVVDRLFSPFVNLVIAMFTFDPSMRRGKANWIVPTILIGVSTAFSALYPAYWAFFFAITLKILPIREFISMIQRGGMNILSLVFTVAIAGYILMGYLGERSFHSLMLYDLLISGCYFVAMKWIHAVRFATPAEPAAAL